VAVAAEIGTGARVPSAAGLAPPGARRCGRRASTTLPIARSMTVWTKKAPGASLPGADVAGGW